MINELKKIYPSLVTNQQSKVIPSSKYKWFLTPDNQLIGISQSDLDHKDSALLAVFLTPYHGIHPPVTSREKAWFQLLTEDEQTDFEQKWLSYRFILFNFSEPITDANDFSSALDGLYSTRPPIIWIDQQTGIIIEEEHYEDMIPYEEMIEVFTTDFYLNVQFYIGPYMADSSDAQVYFEWIQDSFEKINKFSINPVIDYIHAIPYLLPTMKDNDHLQFLIKATLKDTYKDEELLRSIQTFIECNSNVSLAAKELYMHRNSLQYRIDKFIEKTGIDVKQFEGALSIYLILLVKRHLD